MVAYGESPNNLRRSYSLLFLTIPRSYPLNVAWSSQKEIADETDSLYSPLLLEVTQA